MSDEGDLVSTKVREAVLPKGFYLRVENLLGAGTPDIYYTIEGVSGWVESKYARILPARMESPVFTQNHRLSTEQENWLYDHFRRGGRGFIFARIVDYYVLVPARCAFEFNAFSACEFDQFRVKLHDLRTALVSRD